MSLANECTDNFFMDESSILDPHLRLLFRVFPYGTPCTMYFQKMQILGVFRPFLQRSLLYLGGTVNETILEVTSTVLRLKSIRRKKKNWIGLDMHTKKTS